MARLMWVIKIREMRTIRLSARQFDMYGLGGVRRVEFFAFTIFAHVAHIMGDSSSVVNCEFLVNMSTRPRVWCTQSERWCTFLFLSSVSDVLCGKYELSKRTRIVGGTEARPGEFPWIVSIRQHRSHACGGVIVNGKWIVTTAHCFCR